MELFERRVDSALAAGAAGIAVYLFYGMTPGLMAGAAVAVLCFAKPLKPIFEGRTSRAAVGLGLLLFLSPIFRVFFPDGFCVTAPLAINSFLGDVPTDGDALRGLIVGSIGNQLIDHCKANLWDMLQANAGQGYFRDLAYPIVGLLLVFWGKKPSKDSGNEVK
jgi:hypothetical protein